MSWMLSETHYNGTLLLLRHWLFHITCVILHKLCKGQRVPVVLFCIVCPVFYMHLLYMSRVQVIDGNRGIVFHYVCLWSRCDCIGFSTFCLLSL